eukprot:PhM_4_TR17548/c0_g1_i1/m.99401
MPRAPPPPMMTMEDLVEDVHEDEDDADWQQSWAHSYELSASGQTFSFAGMYTLTRDGLMVNVSMDDAEYETKPHFIFFEDLDMENASEVGKGASGTVLQVAHIPTGMMLVLKRISVAQDTQRNEIKRELDMLSSRIGSSHFVVRFYGAFYDNGYVYIALERLHASLSDCLKITQRIPENVLRVVTRDVLQGFVFLHEEHRRVHRDIKPSNLLLSVSGEVKLADFGVASDRLNSINSAKTFLGTLSYMSPERLQGTDYKFEADVWSLGMTLLECATGTHPYRNIVPSSAHLSMSTRGSGSPAAGSGEFFEIYRAVSTVDLLETSTCGAACSLSADFRDLLSHMLEKDPRRRWGALALLAHPYIRAIEDETLARECVRQWCQTHLTEEALRRARQGPESSSGTLPPNSVPGGATASKRQLGLSALQGALNSALEDD